MGQHSTIEWCDSTLNLQMGCDGCELWNPAAGVKHCYAGTLTERYAGGAGWPASFAEPKLFLERLDAALRWPDLTGTKRADKPWIDGRPRVIFLDDMGDTFTESLPVDWLLPLVPRMEASPHLWLLLTKRANRMRKFFDLLGRVPKNFWPGMSVTSQASMGRIAELMQIDSPNLWVSYEPALGPVDFTKPIISDSHYPTSEFTITKLGPIRWVVIGGESGPGARPFDIQWARNVIAQGRAAGVPVFVKQLGARPVSSVTENRTAQHYNELIGLTILDLCSRKGGDPAEWPEDLRVREFPRAVISENEVQASSAAAIGNGLQTERRIR